MTAPTDTAPPARLDRPTRWIAAWLAVLGVGLILLLGPQWLSNPDLSHGIFAPVACLMLLFEARRRGPPRFLAPATSAGLGGLALALGILGIAAGGLYAAAVEWTHALVGFTFAAAFACLLIAAIAILADRRVATVPLNWSALVAAGIWLLSAPIPPGTYTRLTLALQLWVTENVLAALHLLGIAAKQHGNVIELVTTSVGVEDACSGVRSLISCLFAGFFFSGTLVRRPWARALIIGLAAPLAIGMNFVRSLVLTLLANGGVPIEGAWHDATGYAILGLTAVILGALAIWLGGREPVTAPVAPPPEDPPHRALRPRRWLAPGLGFATVLATFLAVHQPLTPTAVRTAPDVEAVLPLEVAGWRVRTAEDLNRFKDTLQTDRFVQRTYARRDADGPLEITVYLAYWAPGQASASLVATHTPDACWPGGGWEAIPVTPTQMDLALPGRTVRGAEHRLFTNQGYPQHVWFWHLYDGKPIPHINPLSPRNLLEIAARYGFRSAGDQMFVRVSSNRPWTAIEHEPIVAELFARMQPLGL